MKRPKHWTQPFQIGALTLPSRFLQAPLAGYSLAPFRQLIQQYSGSHLTYTEMLPATLIAQQNKNEKDPHLWKDPREQYLGYQLGGSKLSMLQHAVEAISAFNVQTIDLNCGCPQRKIRKKGWGSALLEDPENLLGLLSQLRKDIVCPFSIKIRLHPENNQNLNKEIIDCAQVSGCDFITIHARHWSERYETMCRYEQAADLFNYAKIPIIINGDIEDEISLTKWLSVASWDGVMIGRASLGKPWLLGQLHRGECVCAPPPESVGDIFYQHLHDLSLLTSEKSALLKMRSLAPYYMASLPNPPCVEMSYCHTLVEAKAWIKAVFC